MCIIVRIKKNHPFKLILSIHMLSSRNKEEHPYIKKYSWLINNRRKKINSMYKNKFSLKFDDDDKGKKKVISAFCFRICYCKRREMKIKIIKIQQWWCRKTWKSTGKYKSDYCHQHKTNHFLCSVEWEMKRKKNWSFFSLCLSVCTVVRYWTDVEHRQRLLLLRFNYWIEYENIYVNRQHTYVCGTIFIMLCVCCTH